MFSSVSNAALEFISSVLSFFYSLPVVGGNYGVAIILLTLAVMVVLMPLTLKATRSTIAMTQLQPELRELQKKYKDDKQQLNQEMMALYQQSGVNPIGGCLPMLAQLPVFLLLFNVIRGLARHVYEKPYFALADHAHRLAGATPDTGATFDPQYLSRNSELYQDLSQETEMGFGPFDLAAQAGDVLQNNVIRSLPYLLLIAFVVATSYYQQRQISRRTNQPDNPTPQQQTQQQLLRILPLMSGIWSFFFPAGLVLYWATSNVFRIGQQAYIAKAMYSEDGPGTKALAAQAKAAAMADAVDDEPAAKSADDNSSASAPAKKRNKNKSAAADDTIVDDTAVADTVADTAESGRSNGRPKSSSNGDNGDNGAGLSREEAWAQRRAARQARTKNKSERKAAGGSDTGGRITPKGTKPPAAKKKRKR
jgi:YidC/Oxa1 family membrane protein insertase